MKLLRTVSLSVLLAFLFQAQVTESQPSDRLPLNAIQSISVKRSPHNPLITFMSSDSLGENINGPSIIRVPQWIKEPLGKYYMYFAHHKGNFIRLAYADSLHGPWQVYPGGTLKLEQARSFNDHIASPDVHVDSERKEIRMYFHGCPELGKKQWTEVAISKDGLIFTASGERLGQFYFRVFQYRKIYYAIAKKGNSGWGELLRSKTGLKAFESRGNFIKNIRHSAVLLLGRQLLVFYSRAKDAPERIVVASVRLADDWNDWVPSEPLEVIRPEKDYEGIQFPVKPSKYGPAIEVQQLRDPCIYKEGDKIYLFYSIAGEMGIAMAELEIILKDSAR